MSARLFATKLKAEWRCADCDALVGIGDRCFRVLDRARSFPVICATCSGRVPGDAETRCAGCLEPIRWSQQDDGWEHEDGEPFRWKTVKCDRCHGQGHFANGDKCGFCEGQGERRSLDHQARPIGAKEE